VIYPVYWQLEYPGGLLRTEPPEGETILHAPGRYLGLRLVLPDGTPVQRVEIPLGKRPVFYRVLSAYVKTSGATAAQPTLDATVFGIGDDPEQLKYGERGSTTLWLWHPHLKRAIDLPKHLFREGSVKHLLQSPIGV
jgi:hypothetical protein